MPVLATNLNCTGCTACASACLKSCITMTENEYGFLRPVIDSEFCISCGLCEKVCPIVNPLALEPNTPKAYAAYSKNEAIRLDSSSGGVFTEIARSVLQYGGAVYGAAYNEQFEVIHICVENEENIAKLRGAKYAQSDLGRTFVKIKQRLDTGRKVLFSGTPCQVSGLKAFLCKDYENLLTVDFVCHSVPSPMAWREYVKYRSAQDNNSELPVAINLRSKETGWSRYQYSNRFTYPSGAVHTEKSGESLYMKLFVGGYINRESCKNCRFKGYKRISDLTIGDFWGIWDVVPEMDDNKGTSVVLIQSAKGEALIDSVRNRLIIKLVTLEEASCQNSAMLNAAKSNPKRMEALEKIRSGKMRECERWFITKKLSILQHVRSFVAKVLRKLKRIF